MSYLGFSETAARRRSGGYKLCHAPGRSPVGFLRMIQFRIHAWTEG